MRFSAARVTAPQDLFLLGIGNSYNFTRTTDPNRTNIYNGTHDGFEFINGSSGNPNLDPYRASQFLVAYENYFAPGAVASAEGFWKTVDSFITTEQIPTKVFDDFGGSTGNITQPVNGSGGEIYGVESAANTRSADSSMASVSTSTTPCRSRKPTRRRRSPSTLGSRAYRRTPSPACCTTSATGSPGACPTPGATRRSTTRWWVRRSRSRTRMPARRPTPSIRRHTETRCPGRLRLQRAPRPRAVGDQPDRLGATYLPAVAEPALHLRRLGPAVLLRGQVPQLRRS